MLRRAQTLTVALALIAAASAAVAQDAPVIEPKADKILQVMSDFLAGAEQFTVHNEQTSDEYAMAGELVELTSTVDLAVRRPGQAHALLHGDLRPMRYWIGGGQFAVMDVGGWTYASASVPSQLDAAIDVIWERYGMKIPLADFISDNPYEALTHGVEWGSYVGLHEIDGVRCHHLAFGQSAIDWQIWIDDGMRPLPRKLLIVYKDEDGAPRYTARMSDWDLSPGMSDSVFRFEPPEGAERIEIAEREAE